MKFRIDEIQYFKVHSWWASQFEYFSVRAIFVNVAKELFASDVWLTRLNGVVIDWMLPIWMIALVGIIDLTDYFFWRKSYFFPFAF